MRGGSMRIGALVLKRKSWEPVAFASPSLALIAIVIIFPLAYSFWLSFRNFDLAVGPDSEFVGGANYVEALVRDTRFINSIWNTAIIIGPSLRHRDIKRQTPTLARCHRHRAREVHAGGPSRGGPGPRGGQHRRGLAGSPRRGRDRARPQHGQLLSRHHRPR